MYETISFCETVGRSYSSEKIHVYNFHILGFIDTFSILSVKLTHVPRLRIPDVTAISWLALGNI